MNADDLALLSKKGICLLRVSGDEWEAIADTRWRGTRFSMNFQHGEARQGKRGGLVLITTSGSHPTLRLGIVTSIGATSTFDSRVVFDLISQVAPDRFDALLAQVTEPTLRSVRDRLAKNEDRFQAISSKLGAAVLEHFAAIPTNVPILVRLRSHLKRTTRFENARALQRDALALALKAFDGDSEASAIALPGEDTAIATVRIMEDAAIEHDARWISGWRLTGSDLTGRATFEKRGERLEVFTANRRPLEKLFGVDLIYLNETRGALVMVQYKMLEPDSRALRDLSREDDENEWVAPIDDQFEAELTRMRRFDKDLDVDGSYRLNPSAFFLKFVRRHAAINTAGILLSLGHLDQMLSDSSARGPRGGLRVGYRTLNGHYLRGDAFVELVRSGYVGTRGATTEHLQELIEASLDGDRAVVAGLQTPIRLPVKASRGQPILEPE